MSGGFFLLSTLLTWPILVRPGSAIYGFGNDNFGGLWQAEWLHKAAFGPEHADFTPALQAPFGNPIDQRFIQPFDRLLGVVFGGLSDGIVAYNIQIFLSFVLAGVTMYALARYVSGSRLAAVLAGVIFTASPYHLAVAMQYQALSSIQWCPLVVLALLVALRRRRVRDAIMLGASVALLWSTSYYYGWFAIWFVLTVLAVIALRALLVGGRARRFGRTVRDGAGFLAKRGTVALVACAALSLPLLFSLAYQVQSRPQAFARNITDLYFAAVKPWQFVLPPQDNPIFGAITHGFILKNLGILPIYEQSVYLGAVPVLFAGVALVRRRRASPAARYAAIPLLIAGLVCILMTLGLYLPVNPFSVDAWLTIGAHAKVKNLSGYLFNISPAFRYYGRAFAWTSVCLAALAAVGFSLAEIRLRRVHRWAPLLGAGLACVLVLAEFINRPNSFPQWLDLSQRPWSEAVKKLPPGTIIDYPEADTNGPRSLYYIFWQARHDHPTTNPAASPRASELWNAVNDPNSPASGRLLYEKGIRYAVIHTGLPNPTFPPYQPPMPNDSLPPKTGARNPWFQHVVTVKDAVIYGIRKPAHPPDSVTAGYGVGFAREEQDQEGPFRWLTNDPGTLLVDAGQRPRRVVVALIATSLAQPRTLTLTLRGRPVAVRRVPPGRFARLRVPLDLGAGFHSLELRLSPGLQPIDALMHNGDPRVVTIRIRKPTVLSSRVLRGR